MDTTQPVSWPAGGGKLGELIRGHDWAATPLGPRNTWPQSLRTLTDLVLDSSVMMSLMVGPRAVLIYNDAYAAGIGKRHPRALGVSAFDAFSDTAPVWKPLFEQALAGECVSVRDLPFRLSSGGELARDEGWYDLTYSPIRNEAGEVAGVLAILADTTDRVLADRACAAAQQVMRAREAHARAIIANLPGGAAFVVDHDLRYRLAGGEGLLAVGRRPAEFEGKTLAEALGPTEAAAFEPFYRRGLAGEPFTDERNEDGRVFATRGVPLRDEHGAVDAVLALSFDITEHKRAQEALRASEDRLRVATHAAQIATFDIDIASGRVVLDPNTMMVLYGSSSGRTDPRPQDPLQLMQEWLRPADARRHGELLQATMRGEGDLHNQLLVRDPATGAESWVEVSATLVRDAAGRPSRVVGIMHNISARKQAEEAQRETESRQAFLLELSDTLRPLGEAAEIQAATSRLLGTYLGADRSMYAEVEGAPGAEEGVVRGQYVRPARGGDPPSVPFPERFAYRPFGARTMPARRSGELLVVANIDAEPTLDTAERAAWASAGVRAAVVAPLVKGGRLVAEFGVQSAAPRAWTPAEVALVQDVAERTWAAVERARAEAALRESEARYRTLFEKIDEGFCTIEVLFGTDGEPVDYVFLETNTAFVQQTGLEGAVGRRMRELAPEHELFWFETYGRIARTGTPERFEHRAAALGHRYEVYAFRIGRPEQHRVAILFNDITQRKQAETEAERLAVAEAVAAERQALLKRIVRAQEEERAKVAREVHDSVTQLAHVAAIHLDRAVELLPSSPEQARPSAERGRDLVRQAANEARRLIAGLRPEMLDLAGLAGALQQEVDALRRAGWRVELEDADLAGVRLDPEAEITLFRVAQEALSNVRKHAGHARVRVRLKRQDGSVRLEVRDWGRGFEPTAVRPTAEGEHVGLTGMRERMDLLGGKLEVRSDPEHGTAIRATLPFAEAPKRGRKRPG